MPLIEENNYKPPLFFENGHLQSTYPSLFRKFDASFYRRERINTTDDDFLDLDWSCTGNQNLAIISHGLEGNSHRAYVVGMVKALNKTGWDALAWNFRSCSGESNRQLRLYHSGSTDDLECVIEHAIQTHQYTSIALIGFSMGGNLSLVYLGQKSKTIESSIQKAVVFSVPTDLKGSAIELTKPVNKIYMKYFLNSLHQKIKAKMKIMPDKVDDDNYHQIKTFKDFDNRYTAPIHGFKDAQAYWHQCSSKQFIPQIRVPTLIINAGNDPFLSATCYPIKEVSLNHNVFLEIPKSGGHVGFIAFNKSNLYWSEKRTVQFLNDSDLEYPDIMVSHP